MKKLKPQISILFLVLVFVFGCSKDSENQPPTCVITSPSFGDEFNQGDIINIVVEANDPDGSIKEVRFYIDDVGKSSSNSFPYNFEWDTKDSEHGNYKIKAVAIDDGNLETEQSIDVSVLVSKYLKYNGNNYSITNAVFQKYRNGHPELDPQEDHCGIMLHSNGVVIDDDSWTGNGNAIYLEGDKTYFNNIFASATDQTVNFVVPDGGVYINVNFNNEEWGPIDYFEGLSVKIVKKGIEYEISLQGTSDDGKLIEVFYKGSVTVLNDIIF